MLIQSRRETSKPRSSVRLLGMTVSSINGLVLRTASLVLLMLATGMGASAQTSSAQLSINLTVQSSISLVFNDNPGVGSVGFCPLTNAGTNNVGLDLGSASFPGDFHSSACVNYSHVGASFYQVSSAFDVLVTKTNSSSPSYRLAAQISTAPPASRSSFPKTWSPAEPVPR